MKFFIDTNGHMMFWFNNCIVRRWFDDDGYYDNPAMDHWHISIIEDPLDIINANKVANDIDKLASMRIGLNIDYADGKFDIYDVTDIKQLDEMKTIAAAVIDMTNTWLSD